MLVYCSASAAVGKQYGSAVKLAVGLFFEPFAAVLIFSPFQNPVNPPILLLIGQSLICLLQNGAVSARPTSFWSRFDCAGELPIMVILPVLGSPGKIFASGFDCSGNIGIGGARTRGPT
jgi:hypothetical protein